MNKGFTLIELMIVVAILGIVAMIGVPQYMGYVDSGRVNIAKNNLMAIHLQQQDYYRRNNAYYATGAFCSDSAAAINTNLFGGQTIITNNRFTYCITQASGEVFTAQAVEVAGGQGRTFTINQLNQKNF